MTSFLVGTRVRGDDGSDEVGKPLALFYAHEGDKEEVAESIAIHFMLEHEGELRGHRHPPEPLNKAWCLGEWIQHALHTLRRTDSEAARECVDTFEQTGLCPQCGGCREVHLAMHSEPCELCAGEELTYCRIEED